ncbi:DUF6236 family protein [Paenibacillus agilis]|uniref:Uncharacterized protein n=1 Tax=Paenibacillus agilis TaxID=3020863 RepID=A0A559J2S4_9BACL|nr:DUF6236 family protein [Paenibacillus agilis]TVX94126.1 hypothetical protein FPZ44_14335 [Paenibacillus agilis]
MRRTIMYYPNIEIPDGYWLKKALLYWDEVSSIVPREVENELYSNSTAINYLKHEGEFRPIYPDHMLNSMYFEEFEKECLRKVKVYLKGSGTNQQRNNRIFENRIHNEKIFNSYGVHRGKLSSRIMEFLDSNGLVTRSGDNWVNFDNILATIYMANLAKYTALSDVNHTVIGTDQISEINRIYPIKYATKQPVVNKVPVVNLSLNILPTPNTDVPYKKIVSFKRKYRDELLAFRNVINEFEKQISNAETEYDMKEQIITFKESVERGCRETTKMLKGAGINTFLTSLRSVINLKSPTMVTTYAGIVGQKLTDLHPAITLSGIAVTGIVDLSVNYIALSKSTQEKLSDKGFLYLHHAKRRGIVNDFI